MIDPTKLMRGAILALALLFVAPFTGLGGPIFGVEAAQAQTVSRISVSGNTRVDDATIISYLAVQQGGVATASAINASIDSLYATGLFSTVNVTFSGGTLAVTVVENPIVASVLFEGNRRFSDAELLTMVDVAARGSYTQERLAADVESIRLAYENSGFTNVKVSARTEATENGRSRIVFVIDEGDRAGIAAINFTGNNNVSAGTLKGIIRTRETHVLSWLFRDDVYEEAKLAADKELIRLYYANHGYPDAQVSSAVAEFDPARNAYFINFTIIEGEPYRFGTIGVETSISGLDPNALTGTIQTREGSRYSLAELQETAEEMALEATTQGFPFADVRPRIDRDVATGTFNVTYLVDEGPRVYVERINITGNNKTRDYVIRRELEFSEGDPFNRALAVRGRANIEELGFFSQVNFGVEQGSASDKVVLNIDVTETTTGDYGITAGYSTADGILGEVSLTERNFLGRGQFLRVALGASASGRTFDFSFTEPRFMGLKISSGIDIYHRISDETASKFYGQTTTGGQVRFGLPVTRDVTATLFTGLETKSIKDEDAPLSGIVDDGDVFNKAFVGYTLTFDGLDDTKKPTEGLFATLTQQYVGWDHNYLKTEARARYFMPVMEDTGLIASVRGQAGVIHGFDGAVHAIEAFRPGPSLIRGFESFGPRLGSGELLGSTMYAGLSAELQFPIPVLPETYGLSGAIWADSAYISGTGGGLAASAGSTDQPLKASVGASVIWDSPFGPLRGDFGYVISKATEDKTQVFQLTLQTLL